MGDAVDLGPAATSRRRSFKKLSHKRKKAVCHSNKVEDADAAKLLPVNTLKALGWR